MNYSTQTIVDFSYYISMVRDLGCYILYEPEQLLNLYEDQKHSLKIEMQVQSPINKVMLNNGEAGQKFRDGALAFYEFLHQKPSDSQNSPLLHPRLPYPQLPREIPRNQEDTSVGQRYCRWAQKGFATRRHPVGSH